MKKVLGLDLGVNSIGWALLDEDANSIIGTGVRIFPEGVNKLGDGENEVSLNASRRINRGVRRQFFRRMLRKRYLLKLLMNYGMCPIHAEEIESWKRTKEFPSSERLMNWIRLNPYELRAKALKEQVSMEELGRIFYHMIQRRGFQSNSRSGGTDEGVLYDGKSAEGKTGINATLEKMKEATLGEYLFSILPKDHEPYETKEERARNRYTTRQMYIDEFERIWEKQKTYYKTLNDDLKTNLGGRKKEGHDKDGVLFFQRPLRSQKHAIGKCSLEPGKPRCPISAIPNEEARVYQWVNTVECNGKRLSEEERQAIISLLFSKEKVAFSAIRKAIKKAGAEWNFNYKDDDNIVGTYTISNLSNKKFFGQDWFSFSPKKQDDIWHVLFFFDDKTKLKDYALKNWRFTEEQALRIANLDKSTKVKFNLKDGYASLSRKALSNILPFLKMGHQYDVAVVLGGVRNAFGEQWEKLDAKDHEFILDNVPAIVKTKMKGGFIDDLRNMLQREYELNRKQLDKLYHHSTTILTTQTLSKLPVGKVADKEIQDIKNPVVVTALFELRKVVNELIERFGPMDEIKIEMARDLKVSKTKRNEIRREQKRLERENDRVKDELKRHGQVISHDNLLRYKLWEECSQTCPYTGRAISVSQLFSGEVQIEHILPWSRSLNDSFMNKTLCFADENRAKGDLTPYEYYSKQGEEKWQEVKERALKLFANKKGYPDAYRKFKQFAITKFESDFTTRALNDTRYISREAKEYLGKVCKNVQVSPGQATANLRQKWGLNDILNPEEGSKTRDDHRHHAVDALVMACTKVSFVQELSRWNRYNRNSELKDFPLPWPGFRQDAEKSIDAILVSHKRRKQVLTVRNIKSKKNGEPHSNKSVAARGQLHKETVFGKRQAPGHKEPAYHVRKGIENLTTKKHIEKVVDPAIRSLILNRIDSIGGFIKGEGIPPNAFFEIDEGGRKVPQIWLPNRNGAQVPVLKVRMYEKLGNAEPLNDRNQHVNPQKNHHVLIYEDPNGNLKEDVVTFWTAAERKRQGQALFQLPEDGARIVSTLMINDMFLLGLEVGANIEQMPKADLKNHLFRVQKFTSGDYYFRKAKESTLEGMLGVNFQYIKGFGTGKTGWKTFNPIKVKITASGYIHNTV